MSVVKKWCSFFQIEHVRSSNKKSSSQPRDIDSEMLINIQKNYQYELKQFLFAPLCQAALRGPYHVPFFEGWFFGWSFDHFSLNYLFFRKIIWVIVLGFCSDIIISSSLSKVRKSQKNLFLSSYNLQSWFVLK